MDRKSESPQIFRAPGPSEQEQRLKVLSSPANICKIDVRTMTIEKLKNESVLLQEFIKTYYKNDRI